MSRKNSVEKFEMEGEKCLSSVESLYDVIDKKTLFRRFIESDFGLKTFVYGAILIGLLVFGLTQTFYVAQMKNQVESNPYPLSYPLSINANAQPVQSHVIWNEQNDTFTEIYASFTWRNQTAVLNINKPTETFRLESHTSVEVFSFNSTYLPILLRHIAVCNQNKICTNADSNGCTVVLYDKTSDFKKIQFCVNKQQIFTHMIINEMVFNRYFIFAVYKWIKNYV